MYYSQSEAKSHPKLSKLGVATDKVGGAELKVGGAAAPPTVGIGNSTSANSDAIARDLSQDLGI